MGEQRVRILSAIAQASETHVKILQEELCKVLVTSELLSWHSNSKGCICNILQPTSSSQR